MQRLHGVDLLRGLAVLGMFAAHVGDDRPPFPSPPGWLVLADGRSAATFALLAGVSAALLDGGHRPRTGERHRHAVVRVLVRAAALWPLGAVMIALGTPVAVILPTYAVMFALTSLTLTWPRWVLLVAAGAVAVVGPVVWFVVQAGTAAAGIPRLPQALDVLLGVHYPAVVWMAYLLVGVAVGRTDLRLPGTAARLAGWGALLAALGYGTGALAAAIDPPGGPLHELLSIAAHANTTTEVVGNVGFTLALLAGCLVLGTRLPRVIEPVASTGALALTAYCGHLVAIALLGQGVVWDPSNTVLGAFVLITVAATWLWRVLLGRGPLERLLHELSRSAADAVVPAGATSPPPPPPGHAGPPGPPPPPVPQRLG